MSGALLAGKDSVGIKLAQGAILTAAGAANVTEKVE
jgi:hypothetical protein